MTISINTKIAGGGGDAGAAVSGVPTGGSDGDLRIRTDSPLAGVPYLNTAGAWAALNNSYTWAARPAAASFTGAVILITDWAQEFYSDGTNWIPVGKRLQLLNSAVESSLVTGTAARQAVFTDTNIFPAGLVIANCRINIWAAWEKTVSTGTSNWGFAFGTTAFHEPATQSAAHQAMPTSTMAFVKAASGASNVRGLTSSTANNSLFGSTTAAPTTATVDFTAAVSAGWYVTVPTASDTAKCIGRSLEIIYP